MAKLGNDVKEKFSNIVEMLQRDSILEKAISRGYFKNQNCLSNDSRHQSGRTSSIVQLNTECVVLKNLCN